MERFNNTRMAYKASAIHFNLSIDIYNYMYAKCDKQKKNNQMR